MSDLAESVSPTSSGGKASRVRVRDSLFSRWSLSVAIAGLGLLNAIYLTWIKLANATIACSNIGDCETVNNSRYSEIASIPIAAFGAAAFAAMLLMLLLDRRPSERSELLRLGVFGLALAGTLYSAYLTYLEFAVLRAVCPFCVASAILLTALLLLSILRLPVRES